MKTAIIVLAVLVTAFITAVYVLSNLYPAIFVVQMSVSTYLSFLAIIAFVTAAFYYAKSR